MYRGVLGGSVRDALQAVAVAALLVLAGCGGAGGPTEATPTASTTDEQTRTPTTGERTGTSTSTDAPTTTTTTTTAVPTTSPSPSDGADRPPGVSGDGVANATALVEAHRRSVVNRGAVTTLAITTNATVDGTVTTLSANETARLAPGGTELRWTSRSTTIRDGETTRRSEQFYANESTFLTRIEDGQNVTTRAANRSSLYDRVVVNAATKARVVNATLSSATFTVADVEDRGGRTVTTLVAVNGTYSGQLPGVVAYNATLTVAESGRVLSLTRSRTVETDRSTSEFGQTVSWSSAEPVERPDWAINASTVTASG